MGGKHSHAQKAEDWTNSANKIYSPALNGVFADAFYDAGWLQRPEGATAPAIAFDTGNVGAAQTDAGSAVEPSPIPDKMAAANQQAGALSWLRQHQTLEWTFPVPERQLTRRTSPSPRQRLIHRRSSRRRNHRRLATNPPLRRSLSRLRRRTLRLVAIKLKLSNKPQRKRVLPNR